MKNRLAVALVACGFLATGQLLSQQAPAPPANPADVASVDAIMRAVYDAISGDSAQARNWDRFRSLFAPGARLIPVGPRQQGGYGARVLTVEEYVESAAPFFARQGFHEREVARRQESYGPIVHLFSTYESRRAAADAQPFMRGINSFQLYNDGRRWWVMTIFWHGETGATPIPSRYLASETH